MPGTKQLLALTRVLLVPDFAQAVPYYQKVFGFHKDRGYGDPPFYADTIDF